MKRAFILILLLPIWVGCNKNGDVRNKEFADTGCALGARDAFSLWNSLDAETPESWLTLSYEDGGLRVTRKNALVNCSVRDGGLVCEVSIEGKTIHYTVYEKDGPTANCLCLVEEMSSVVTGLSIGKEYTLDYYCAREYSPITFVFNKGLFSIVEMNYRPKTTY